MPDTSTKSIGERLTAVREARGLTQSGLARAIGVSAQRWGNYERGERVPPPDLLAKFWQITGGTSDYVLFGRMDGMPFDLAQLLANRRTQDEADEARSHPSAS